MIKMKDLVDRRYSGKACQSFAVELNAFNEMKQEIETVKVEFKKEKSDGITGAAIKRWTASMLIPPLPPFESKFMSITFDMERTGMALEKIAARGLFLLKHVLSEQANREMQFLTEIAEYTEGM